MTPDQIHLLRRSFARLEPHATVAALAFYRRLFQLAPQVRPLFKTEIESQSAKLMEMLGLAVSLTDRPASIEAELRALGARHVDYGTRDEHYPVVGTALLDMLAEVLGEEFTPAAREAWTEFFDLVSRRMLEGAAEARTAGAIAAGAAPETPERGKCPFTPDRTEG